jgi:predicted nucleic-acid-binding Zn-ribbon protein
MKLTGACPKCRCQDIVRVPGEPPANHVGNFIGAGGLLGNLVSIPVTRFVCCTCGYSEEWIDSRTDLKKLQERYRVD